MYMSAQIYPFKYVESRVVCARAFRNIQNQFWFYVAFVKARQQCLHEHQFRPAIFKRIEDVRPSCNLIASSDPSCWKTCFNRTGWFSTLNLPRVHITIDLTELWQWRFSRNSLARIDAPGYPAGEAFAALQGDGTIVAWGSPHFVTDCSGIQEELKTLWRSVTHAALQKGRCATGHAGSAGHAGHGESAVSPFGECQPTCG